MDCSLSVILPCYKVAQYIEHAIDSILQQDFTDYEVIIINDGSPDNLLEVCEKWGGKSNFTIVTTENQGVSQARNEGLERAQGKYVFFMDPDDCINPGMFREVIEKCQEGDYDAVHFGFQMIDEVYNATSDSFEEPYVYSSNQEIIKEYLPKFIGYGQKDIDYWKDDNLRPKHVFASAWRFFYKRSVLMEHHVRFHRDITMSEDRFFNCLFLFYANSIATMDKMYYNYFLRENGSLTEAINNHPKLVKDKMNGVTERGLLRKQYLQEKGIDIFYYYNGTVVFGALEIIVRGAQIPIAQCVKAARKYLALEDVKEAYRTTDLSGLPSKMKYPALMVKYGVMPLLVVLVHIMYFLGVKMKP